MSKKTIKKRKLKSAIEQIKKKEAKKIKSSREAADFMIKYHPYLKKIDSVVDVEIETVKIKGTLLELFFEQLPNLVPDKPYTLKIQNLLQNNRMTRWHSKEHFEKIINLLNTSKRKIEKYSEPSIDKEVKSFIKATNELIAACNESIPPAKGGGKVDFRNDIFSDMIKGFWIVTLEHENFYYDEYGEHKDLACDFVHDMVLAHFRGQEIEDIRGLKSSVKYLSDKRN